MLYVVVINIIADIMFVMSPNFRCFVGSKSSTKDDATTEKILYKRVAV